jgi:Glycosyl hydrolase family 26
VKRTLIIILITLLACGCSAHVATRTAAAPKPGTSRFLIGAAAPSAAQFRQATGVQPDIVEHYVRTGAAFSVNFAAGAIPLIQLMPYDVSLASVANGDEDDWLRSYARAAAAYQRPVILGFAPEMNGSWYPWGDTHVSPAGYIAAWRHVVTVFRGQGALNVTWLWTVNVAIIASGSSPSNGVGAATPWWPGAAWVDWAGVDGYFYRSSETFGVVFGNTLGQIRALTPKPVLISETAVAPAAGKAAKIPGLFAGAYAAGMAGLVWFDLPGNRDWQLDEDQAALAAFRAAVARYRNPVAPPTPSPTGTGSSPPAASPTGTGSSPPAASPTGTGSSPPTPTSTGGGSGPPAPPALPVSFGRCLRVDARRG